MAAPVSPILVFGGSGQLGRELVRMGDARGIPLRALTRLDADIADPAAVDLAISEYRPSLVVNAAAYTRVDDAEVEREAAERANVTGPLVLARRCETSAIPLVQISSDYVFDGTKTGAYVETDPVAPLSFYGVTKLRGEDAVRSATDRHVILRVSWLFGEFGQNFLKTMLRLAAEREEIRVVADQRGCPTSTRELASAIFRVSDRLRAEREWGTYHFAGDGVTTWHGFASAIVARFCKASGRRVQVLPISTAEYPTKTKRPVNSALDCGKFVSTFGLRARPWQAEVDEITEQLVRGAQGALQ